MKRILFFLLCTLCLFSGCKQETQLTPRSSVIRRITVLHSGDGTLSIRQVENDNDISAVMEQFRHLTTHIQRSNPALTGQDIYSFLIECVDGSTHIYEKIDYSYLRKDRKFWREIVSSY